MGQYIITKKSTIIKNNRDGKDHSRVTPAEKPCANAYISDLIDVNGNTQSRYMIDLNGIGDLYNLEKENQVNTLLRKNKDFPDYIAIVLEDI